jgi:hypothetical protein
MNDTTPNRPKLRFRPMNVLIGLLLLAVAGLLGILGRSPNSEQQGFLPWFDARILDYVMTGCMVMAALVIICKPTRLHRYSSPEERREDNRQFGAITGATPLPWWIVLSLLLLIFAAFAALLWAGMWE